MRKLIYIIFLFSIGLSAQVVRYVTVTGGGTHDGTSEANAWTLSEALANDAAGMTIYVKAGLYGTSGRTFSTSGQVDDRIEYIGYTTTPGDLDATNGAGHGQGDGVPSSATWPIIGDGNWTGTGIQLNVDYLTLKNLVIKDFSLGANIPSFSDGVTLDNLIVYDMGDQTAGTGSVAGPYDGFGIRINVGATDVTLRNIYVENPTAEGISIRADGSLIDYCYVFSDNVLNPTDYYVFYNNGASQNLATNVTVHRTDGLAHGGHGFTFKDLANDNIGRNITAIGTSIEFNFSGAINNLIEGFEIYNQGTGFGQWQATVSVGNGAGPNTLKNGFIHDTFQAFSGFDTEDGYVGPGGDRDEANVGDGMVFENIVLDNVNRFFSGNSRPSAKADNWVFRNITGHDVQDGVFNYFDSDGWEFYNVGIKDKTGGGNWITNASGGTSTNFTGSNNLYNNSSGSWPSYFASSGNPNFVNENGTTANSFDISTGSAWINAGSSVNGSTTDFNGESANGNRDVGAFEFNGSGGGDVTAPTITNITESNITENAFTLTWSLNEAASGRVYFDQVSRTFTTDIPTTIALYSTASINEPNFLTVHQQSPGPTNPGPSTPLESGTVYYYRILGADAAGNQVLSSEGSVTTLNLNPPPPPQAGVKGRIMLRKKKL